VPARVTRRHAWLFFDLPPSFSFEVTLFLLPCADNDPARIARSGDKWLIAEQKT
jgi:hypothetical protein